MCACLHTVSGKVWTNFKTSFISFEVSELEPSLRSLSALFICLGILRTPLPDEPARADQTWLDLSNQQIMTLHPSIHLIHAATTDNWLRCFLSWPRVMPSKLKDFRLQCLAKMLHLISTGTSLFLQCSKVPGACGFFLCRTLPCAPYRELWNLLQKTTWWTLRE